MTAPFPKVYQNFRTHVMHFMFIPVFLLFFVLFFRPEPFVRNLSGGVLGYSANLAIVFSIVLFSVFFSRLILYLMRNDVSSMPRYALWCLMEVVFCVLFSSLYLCLTSRSRVAYFDMVTGVAPNLGLMLLMPYLMLTLLYLLVEHERYPLEPAGDSRIKFYDENHVLRLVALRSSVLFITADENYCRITYSENGGMKTYSLRCSMRSLEDVCQKFNILRCHRSYFVNVQHVKSLRKEKEGVVYIELDAPDARHIPVSKKYYEQISAML